MPNNSLNRTRYGTEEGCERELENQRWPQGFACPVCDGREYSNFRRGRLLYYQRCSCRHQSSLLSGTMLESTKLPLRKWFQAAYVLTQAKNNVSGLELMGHLGVSAKTACSIKHKLMEAMWLRERTRTLQGTVQIDEAFLGGEATGRHSWGRRGKVALLAAVSFTPQGKPGLVCFSAQPATGEDVVVFTLNSLKPGTLVVCDGAPSFNYVKWQGSARYRSIITEGGKQSYEIPEFKAINVVLGDLKTTITGTYQAFKFAKYAYRYLAKYQYRFNRRFDLASLMQRLIRAVANASPTPMQSLRLAEDCR